MTEEKEKTCQQCRYRFSCGRWYQSWEPEKNSCCFCQAKISREVIEEGCPLAEWDQKNLELWEAKQFNCWCREVPGKVKSYSYYFAWCEKCERGILPASKKGVIKNRNDARFWGLAINERVLCGGCLGQLKELMPKRKKYTYNDYTRRGYFRVGS